MDTQTARQKTREQDRAKHAEYIRHWHTARRASNVDEQGELFEPPKKVRTDAERKAGACRSACLTVEPASPAPWPCRCARQAPEPAGDRAWFARRHRASLRPLPEPAGVSIPTVSPAGVALRLPVRQSGAYRRNQTVGFCVGSDIPAMAESFTDSVTYADSDRNADLARIGPEA